MKGLRTYRILTLLAGIATAMVIVLSQLFYFQAATYCQKKADTEQQQKTGEENYISIPASSVSTGSHIELNQDVTYILETLLTSEEKSEETSEVAPLVSRLLQALFRFTIAPNAP